MEIIAELLWALVQIVAEFLLQLAFEALANFGWRAFREPFQPKPVSPVVAAVGYTAFGAIGGGLSLLVVPHMFIETEWLRIVNLVVTPLAAGAVMAAIGAWRDRRHQTLFMLDRFGYGFIFAFTMSAVRFTFGA